MIYLIFLTTILKTATTVKQKIYILLNIDKVNLRVEENKRTNNRFEGKNCCVQMTKIFTLISAWLSRITVYDILN